MSFFGQAGRGVEIYTCPIRRFHEKIINIFFIATFTRVRIRFFLTFFDLHAALLPIIINFYLRFIYEDRKKVDKSRFNTMRDFTCSVFFHCHANLVLISQLLSEHVVLVCLSHIVP